jgi:hypothetical protein
VARRSDTPCEQVCRGPSVVAAGTGGGAWSLRCCCIARGLGGLVTGHSRLACKDGDRPQADYVRLYSEYITLYVCGGGYGILRSVTSNLVNPSGGGSAERAESAQRGSEQLQPRRGRALLSTAKSPQSSATKKRAISKQITISADELKQVQKALAMCNVNVCRWWPSRFATPSRIVRGA